MSALVRVTYLGGEVREVHARPGEELLMRFAPERNAVLIAEVNVEEEVIEWDLIKNLFTEGAVRLAH